MIDYRTSGLGAGGPLLLGVALVLASPTVLETAPSSPERTLVLEQERDGTLVYLVPVTGTIELGLSPFIERSLGEARRCVGDHRCCA
jgi:hypothetical protein